MIPNINGNLQILDPLWYQDPSPQPSCCCPASFCNQWNCQVSPKHPSWHCWRSSTIKEIQQPHYLIDKEYHKTEQMLSQAAFKGLVGFKENFFGIPEFPCSCPVGNCFIPSVDCWQINWPLLKQNDYPITQLLLSLERSNCYWEW